MQEEAAAVAVLLAVWRRVGLGEKNCGASGRLRKTLEDVGVEGAKMTPEGRVR
jgi:hypothetical protein